MKAGWVPLFACRLTDHATLRFRDMAHLQRSQEYLTADPFCLDQWGIAAERGDVFLFNEPRDPVPGHAGYQLIVFTRRSNFPPPAA